ncbi:MAG: phosphotransferase family protein, partial [Vicinamibacterales bacterium]
PLAADSSCAAAALTRLLGEPVPAGGVRVSIVRYVPEKRCLLRYAWTDDEGRARHVLAKVYPNAEDLAAGAVQATLHSRPDGRPGPNVARVLGFWTLANVFVQEEVDGRPLYELLRAGRAGLRHQSLAAGAIQALHASSVPLSRAHGPDDELRVVTQAVERSFLRGAERASAQEWLALLTHRRRNLPDGPLRPSHCDFYDKQVLVDADRAILIDFDTASLAPVEIDLANYVAHLRLRALQGYCNAREASQHAEAFLGAYRAAGGAWDDGSFDWVLATTWLRLSCVYRSRPAWPDLPGHLLAEVGCVLRDGPAWPAVQRSRLREGGR